jgi:phytoene synthase
MMTALMDPDDAAAARPHATALGEAFQLTNFLRDVREDVVDFDRIYVPRATLRAHGVDEADVEALRSTPAFADAVEAELARTERLYDRGVAGIDLLPADCRFAVLLSAVLYADHHRLIRERGCDVVSATPSLSMRRRLRLVARTWRHWRGTRDAREAFYAASVVDPPAERADPLAEPIEPGSLVETDADAGPEAGPDADAVPEAGEGPALDPGPARVPTAASRPDDDGDGGRVPRVADSARSIAGALLGGG